jgi:protein-S-isoprenylcysteine O-methyltransferase Ste14
MHLSRFERFRGYDATMRLPILAWSIVLTILSIVGLERYVCQASPALSGPVVLTMNVSMRLSVISYLVMIAATTLARTSVIAKGSGAEPRICAFIGAFLITVIVLFPRRELSLPVSGISTFLIVAGNILAVFVLSQLRGSFSIMPEARQLVSSGLYRFIRHPLYLAEEIAAIGGLIQFLSVWTIGLLVVQLAFQLRRMRNEERLLAKVFPDYRLYQERTARIIPGVY